MAEPPSFLVADAQEALMDWEKFITVRVGTLGELGSCKDFTVHENNIRLQCPFFEAAMARNWKESEERIVLLPEHRPDAFKLYLGWIYQKRIIVSSVDLDEGINNGILRKLCCRGFLLGEFLHDNDFKDAIIDAFIDIIKTSSNTYYTSGFDYVYKNTPEDSPLRRLFVDQLVYTRPKNMPGRVQALRKTDVTPEALFDIILAMAATKEADSASSSDAPFSKNTCHYHVHGSENPCYKVKYKITGVLRPSLSTTSDDSTTKLDVT